LSTLLQKKYFSSSPVVVLHCRRRFHPPAAKPSRSPAVSNRARSAPPRGESPDPAAPGVRPGQLPEIWDPHLQCEPAATVLYSQLEGAVHLLRAWRRRPPVLPCPPPSSPAPMGVLCAVSTESMAAAAKIAPASNCRRRKLLHRKKSTRGAVGSQGWSRP
jgi:hypothetical protein